MINLPKITHLPTCDIRYTIEKQKQQLYNDLLPVPTCDIPVHHLPKIPNCDTCVLCVSTYICTICEIY